MRHHSRTNWPLLVIAIVALALVAAVPSAPGNPWKGAWWSIDVPDGSLQRVVFGGQGYFSFIDWGASVCGLDGNGEPLYAARIVGRADEVTPTTFTGFAPVVCMTHPPSVWDPNFPFAWTYDSVTNTLWDGRVTWTRTKP